MDVYVTGPRWLDVSGPGPWPNLQICTDLLFYWDGTGTVAIQAAATPGHAINYFDYWGWGYLSIGEWAGSLPWQYNWDTWKQAWNGLAGFGFDLIRPGANRLSWYQQPNHYGAGINSTVWIVGSGVTPGNRIDIGAPQFQFQIGPEPPGT
jgi:hypothetical protein